MNADLPKVEGSPHAIPGKGHGLLHDPSTQADPPPSTRARLRRFRSRRVGVGELRLEGLEAAARHAALGSLEARVVDLSPTGMALVVAGAGRHAGLVRGGDRLEGVRILFRASMLGEGDAIVRRSYGAGEDLLLGVELRPGIIDLPGLYRLSARLGFRERMAAAFGPPDSPVPDGFKAWVRDKREELEKLKGFLDSEEAALAGLDMSTRRQTLDLYLDESGPWIVERMNAASHELSGLASGFREEQHAACRRYYREEMHPLLLHSPFMKRAFEKPLGYAGDFEMMNMLYRDHAEGDSLFAKAMNLYATQETAARANINRLDYLGARIGEALEAKGRIRLASIGCGPAREIGAWLEAHPGLGRHLDVALLDQEERALVYCERTLSPLAARTGARFRFVRETVRRLLGARELRESLGECDLIYSAGLFDYLNRKSFSALLCGLYDALAAGGQLCIGNVAVHNPTRHTMEYLLDWFLIHRSPEELEEFGRALHPRPSRVEVDAEATGVNLFLRIRK